MRQLAAAYPVSHLAVWRVLHEQLLYPYHLRFEVLTPVDYHRRIFVDVF
jgi:hypothetical protein